VESSSFKIYYSDRVVEGLDANDWRDAPDSDVQVIVKKMDPSFCSGRTYKRDNENIVVYGKKLWDGDDVFDPFDWGPKYGKLLTDDQYFAIWNTACGDT
jgi:hypothetical protein